MPVTRLLALAALPLAMAAPAAAATVAPYVQGGTPDAMTVMWHSDRASAGRVVAVDAAGHRFEGSTPAGLHHAVALTGLTPGTIYRYTAYEGGAVVGTGSFRTNGGPQESRFRFVVVGDSGSGNANQAAVASRMAQAKPAFVIHTGDVIYERGEAANYGPRFFKPYGPMLGSTVFYPSLGNHDYGTGHATAYQDYFDPPTTSGTEQWYTFRYGTAQFFALDSNMPFGPGSAQTRWLTQELARSKAPWKIAFFHHPPYSSGDHGSSHTLRQAWSPLFEKYNVQVVFTGHDHHYERVTPREDFVRDGVPTTYFVTGGGGAWLRGVKPQDFTAKAASIYHFLDVEVTGDHMVVKTIDKDGQRFDQVTIDRL